MKNENLIAKLNHLLSNYQIFYQNLRGYHWNIQGKFFFELHAKFEEMYTDAAVKVDDVAERILTIGGTPLHSFSAYIEHSTVNADTNVHDAETAVSSITKTLEALLALEKEIKEDAIAAGDDATEDLMSDFIDEQEKTQWMFRAWLK